MGMGLISGAWRYHRNKSKDKNVMVTDNTKRLDKETKRRIEGMKRNLDKLYEKYKEKAKDIPDWAKRTDPTLVGIEIQVSELQDKISREQEKLEMMM